MGRIPPWVCLTSGTRQSGTITVKEYRVAKWDRERGRTTHVLGREVGLKRWGQQKQVEIDALTATQGHGMFWPGLQPRAILGLWSRCIWDFVLMSVAPVTTEGHMDTWSLAHNLRPCWCTRDICLHRGLANIGVLRCSPLPVCDIWPRLLSGTVSGSVALLWLGSEFTSMAPVSTKGHAEPQSPGRHLRTCWF